MRENYRNSIVSVKKFPQFTTTNVIEGHVSAINIEIGQAGIVAIFSLIFYYITLDNILNIIVDVNVNKLNRIPTYAFA